MAASDRLYEIACETRDIEQRLDAVMRDDGRTHEALDRLSVAVRELLDRIEEVGDAPEGVSLAAKRLRDLIS